MNALGKDVPENNIAKIENVIANKALTIITFLLSILSEIYPSGHWKNAPAKVIKINKIET